MRNYELMYIIRPDVEEAVVQSTIEKFQSIINNGGEIANHEYLGKRRLAYEIKKFHDGFYVIVKFNATPEIVKELDRVMRISDEVIRHMVINAGA
ncbi:MAG: 30S ribosomal protein S6 [Paenibacillus sp. RIFOXYA1_FULL_44_5]|nr:MAG: 30S ribosomal protein S6 [Paenibacillus sp. RIFOXYA1_FULL_44_5]